MSIFNPNIVQDETDIIRQRKHELYEKMMWNILFTANEIDKHPKSTANYIVTSAPVIKDLEKTFILTPNL